MTRRELYRFVETVRSAARNCSTQADGQSDEHLVLNAFRLAMQRRRGQRNQIQNGEAILLPLIDCDDARTLLDEDDCLGRVYQALNAPAMESAYRSSAHLRQKFADHEISAVSQVFTPRWVVEFLLHNTLGKLWVELHPTTRLRQNLNWLVSETGLGGSPMGKRPKNTRERIGMPGKVKGKPPVPPQARLAREIRVLDPACGTMNFGLVAYELLYQMYAEELVRAGEIGWLAIPSVASHAEIPSAIVRTNLFGIDIDPTALDLARSTLQLKSGVDLSDDQWNLWLGDSLFDEQIARRCADGFDVIATNPPYVSARNLSPAQVARMKKRYPAAWRDLYACFIERAIELSREGGRVGLLAMQSFLFTGAYQKLRTRITDRAAMETMAHFGPGLFDVGNPGTLQTVAFVARKEANADRRRAQRFTAFRLTDIPADQKHDVLQQAIALTTGSADCRYDCPQSALRDLPRQSWAYWVDAPLRRAFKTFGRLATVSSPRQGLATTDNARFVRYWWEVEPMNANSPARATPGKWFAYAKSGQFRRWHELPRHRVNWQNDGREIKQAIIDRYPYLKGEWRWVAKNAAYYGREGITWSYLTSGRFSARRLEPGAIFDVAGSSLFPDDIPGMLALLNSSVVHRLLQAINPTVNFQVGDLAELPVPEKLPAELGALALKAIALQKELDTGDETAPDFVAPMAWDSAIERAADIAAALRKIEQEIDAVVCGVYSLRCEPAPPAAEPAADRSELARRWVSFAVGRLLGRWNAAESTPVLQIDPAAPRVLARLREILGNHAGERPAREIQMQIGGIDRFLANEFYPWHVRIYRRRPPYWALRLSGSVHLILHDAATRENLLPMFTSAGERLPDQWERNIDGGIQPALARLREWVADRALAKALGEPRTEGTPEVSGAI
ncbi:MAG TPA: N-6 DNA methylase [Tepidisphaeraceae bacterium]|jgi:hypothetical protein|nr:N-6 DNA methylase [Tepidisphaeraceae bacterium]